MSAYKIKEGDTLGALAKMFGTTTKELARKNKIIDPNKIFVGDTINVPKQDSLQTEVRSVMGGRPRVKPEPEAAAKPENKGINFSLFSQAAASEKPMTKMPDSYTVKSGDTFNQIAKTQGITTEKLRSLNPNIEDVNKIKVGQALKFKEDKAPEGVVQKAMKYLFGDDEEKSLLEKPKEPLSSTLIPSPVKLVTASLFGKGTGTTFTEEDVGQDVVSVVSEAGKKAREAGRMNASYEDYPSTARGLPVAALVGASKYADGKPIPQRIRNEYAKQRNEMYPKNPIGLAKFVSDVATDPVLKAALTVGGFSIYGEEGNYSIQDRFNFNTKNKSKDDWYAWVRNKLSNSGMMPIGEDEGVRENFKI